MAAGSAARTNENARSITTGRKRKARATRKQEDATLASDGLEESASQANQVEDLEIAEEIK